MQRIAGVSFGTLDDDSRAVIDALRRRSGTVPNMFRVLAHSPVVLRTAAHQIDALRMGVLSVRLQQQIALAVAGANHCDYSASAHAVENRQHGIGADEAAANLVFRSHDQKAQAALSFAQKVLALRGHVTDFDLNEVRQAGYSDAEVVEIVAHLSMHLFANFINNVALPDLDFPHVGTRV